jgi:hypothetical protein
VKKYSLGIVAAIVCGITACNQPAPHTEGSVDGFYNIAALVQQEKQRLQQLQPAVLKSVKTGDAPAETKQLENLDWNEELSIFEEADISKPTIREYYTRQEESLPDGSKVLHYTRKPDASAPVTYLRLQLSPSQVVQLIEAELLDENMLFYSRRKATLQASPQTGRLRSYEVIGVQKMIFGDSLHYTVQANL